MQEPYEGFQRHIEQFRTAGLAEIAVGSCMCLVATEQPNESLAFGGLTAILAGFIMNEAAAIRVRRAERSPSGQTPEV